MRLFAALSPLILLACSRSPVPVSVQPTRIAADGEATAVLIIDSSEQPAISFSGNSRGVSIESPEKAGSQWKARLRAGILPGSISLQISAPGYRSRTVALETVLDTSDSAADGTPDFLRLNDDRDQKAFRSWFVWLAEAQYFLPAPNRQPEIDDCAALIRYAYREALRKHDSAWANSAKLPEFPPFDSVAKYSYPFTPLNASLFRTRPGSFAASDLNDATFLQFADAQTLWRLNTHFVTRDITRAQPGDLLFFRREGTFHGMIYVGASQVGESKGTDGRRYLIYHTGPAGSDPGELRRPTVEELMRFPQPEWRPEPANPTFLGVYRWNILNLRRRPHDPENASLH